ncbi:MAG: tetratricopeptide repeat protein [Magnetococcales bacterium]|nr:tetratricopeptide repeat protein [Magnetococcales bacterium]
MGGRWRHGISGVIIGLLASPLGWAAEEKGSSAPTPPRAAPPGAASAATPTPGSIGYLQVNVNAPEAWVSLNGKPVGKAGLGKPLNLSNLPVGPVELRVEARGFRTLTRQVKVEPHRWVQELAILDLHQGSASSSPSAAAPAASGKPTATAPSGAPAAPASKTPDSSASAASLAPSGGKTASSPAASASKEEKKKTLAALPGAAVTDYKLPPSKAQDPRYIRPNIDPATLEPKTPKEAYDQAMTLFKAGKFDMALEAFTFYLEKFSNDSMIPQARFAIGDIHYVQRQHTEALKEYQLALAQLPQNPLVPQTLLRMGNCYFELGDLDNAHATYERVQQEFPASDAAAQAVWKIKEIQ